MVDKTTKLLLGVIAVALCGLLIRPFIWPAGVRAATDEPSAHVAVGQHAGVPELFIVKNGRLYKYGLLGDMRYHLSGSFSLERVGTDFLEFKPR